MQIRSRSSAAVLAALDLLGCALAWRQAIDSEARLRDLAQLPSDSRFGGVVRKSRATAESVETLQHVLLGTGFLSLLTAGRAFHSSRRHSEPSPAAANLSSDGGTPEALNAKLQKILDPARGITSSSQQIMSFNAQVNSNAKTTFTAPRRWPKNPLKFRRKSARSRRLRNN